MMRQGYNPATFLIYNDNDLLTLYCQAVAALGLAAPPYLLILKDAIGGLEQTVVYGLRFTGATSAFLLLVHFIAANARVVPPRHRRDKVSLAPVHAQHALSLLFTAHQMHFASAAALAYLFPQRLLAQPLPLTALMTLSYAALALLARLCGALRCTWTAVGAARALAARPGACQGATATACRYVLAATFTITFVWRAVEHALNGRVLSHSTVGALAFAGGWAHAAISWQRRRRDAQAAEVALRGKDE